MKLKKTKSLVASLIAIILCFIGLIYGSYTTIKFLRLNNVYKALEKEYLCYPKFNQFH